ncbi:MAG TPA: response regulator [Acidimicrobiales bacterium]|nr:response regulator [Acidimicrobiales bacterium]
MGTKVVIAEDEALIRLDIKEMLEEEGYEVVGETGRGDEAVTLVKEHSADLAVLDIRMPGLDGLSAARQITEAGETAVVILTAFSQRNLIEEARDAGVLAYLAKPFRKDELVSAIEVAMARFREMKALESENQDLQQKLETRKAVDRAKGMLMDQHGWTEEQAFVWIRSTAMDNRLKMKEIADQVISGERQP